MRHLKNSKASSSCCWYYDTSPYSTALTRYFEFLYLATFYGEQSLGPQMSQGLPLNEACSESILLNDQRLKLLKCLLLSLTCIFQFNLLWKAIQRLCSPYLHTDETTPKCGLHYEVLIEYVSFLFLSHLCLHSSFILSIDSYIFHFLPS